MSLVVAYTLDASNEIVNRAECATVEGAKLAAGAWLDMEPTAVSAAVVRYATNRPSDEVAQSWHTSDLGGWVRER